MDHQNHKENIITNGLKLSLFHINFGSIIFHIRNCIQISIEERRINGIKGSLN